LLDSNVPAWLERFDQIHQGRKCLTTSVHYKVTIIHYYTHIWFANTMFCIYTILQQQAPSASQSDS